MSLIYTIPYKEHEEIIVEDDGTGMSYEEFRSRWMTLNYDRQRRQGKEVSFPPDTENTKRIAYGRNGIGRHGMLCFADSYTVETWKDGTCNIYDIAVSHGDAPFKIHRHVTEKREGHGTKIRTFVQRHLPDANAMTDIISARFLYDPKFVVKINGRKIDLSQHKGVVFQKELTTDAKATLSMFVIDSKKRQLNRSNTVLLFGYPTVLLASLHGLMKKLLFWMVVSRPLSATR